MTLLLIQDRDAPGPVHAAADGFDLGVALCGHQPPDRFIVSSNQDPSALSACCQAVLDERQCLQEEAAKNEWPPMMLTWVPDPNPRPKRPVGS